MGIARNDGTVAITTEANSFRARKEETLKYTIFLREGGVCLTLDALASRVRPNVDKMSKKFISNARDEHILSRSRCQSKK